MYDVPGSMVMTMPALSLFDVVSLQLMKEGVGTDGAALST